MERPSIGEQAPEEDRQIGLTSRITRRDFLNNSLLGSGAALLSAVCPMHASAQAKQTTAGSSYIDYERTIRRQMTEMFGSLGFDAKHDIAGIILNRCGHARVIQPPGFYYGVNGKPSPREVVARGYGRIVIGHPELNGAQNYTRAFQHAKRCADKGLGFELVESCLAVFCYDIGRLGCIDQMSA